MNLAIRGLSRLSVVVAGFLLSSCGSDAGQIAVGSAVEHAKATTKAVGPIELTRASNCPAMIKAGTWSATPTKPGTILSNARTLGISMLSQAGKASAYSVNIKRSCEPGFTMTVADIAVQMNPIGTDRRSGQTVYVGKAPVPRVNASYIFRNEEPNNGLLDLVVSGVVKAGDGSTSWQHQLNYGGKNGQRVECQCRALLEKEIQQAIKHAERWQQIYQDKALQKQPARWNEYARWIWDSRKYDAMLDYMYLDPNNPRTQKQAVEKVYEDYVNKLTGSADQSPEANNAAAYVDSGTCKIHFGTDHLNYCNSEVIKEATIHHETLHQAQCQSRRARPKAEFVATQIKKDRERSEQKSPKDPFKSQKRDEFSESSEKIPEFAKDEVKSYQSEIDFLNNWIPNNCS